MLTYKPTYNFQKDFSDSSEVKGYQRQFPINLHQGAIEVKPEEPANIPLIETPIVEENKEEGLTIEPYTDNTKFVADLEAAYVKELTKRGIDPAYAKYLVAQDALETNYGRSFKGRFNFGNITVGSSGASYTEGKDKDINGNIVTQRFRNYNSLEEYIAHKIALLSNSRYRAFTGDISKFYDRVKAGNYAEDPEYVTKLNNMYRSIYKAKSGIKIPEMPWFLK